MSEILNIKNLVKHYGNVRAVNNISFKIDTGVCFGLLGPNGAGKTTTIEIIEDIISPTSGEILYKGHPRSKQFKEEIGIQFQHTSLLNSLKVLETLETFQKLYTTTYSLDEAIELCHLGDIRDQYNDKISGGQRQRLLLALALINKPQLIFLDEPTTGLDPQSRKNFWDIIENIKKKGKTIILTTHYMEEAEMLCDEIGIMNHGKIVTMGPPSTLIKKHCKDVTVIIPRKGFTTDPNKLHIDYRIARENVEIHTEDINSCIKALLSKNIDLSEMTVRSPNLEDVFLKLTGKKLRE